MRDLRKRTRKNIKYSIVFANPIYTRYKRNKIRKRKGG